MEYLNKKAMKCIGMGVTAALLGLLISACLDDYKIAMIALGGMVYLVGDPIHWLYIKKKGTILEIMGKLLEVTETKGVFGKGSIGKSEYYRFICEDDVDNKFDVSFSVSPTLVDSEGKALVIGGSYCLVYADSKPNAAILLGGADNVRVSLPKAIIRMSQFNTHSKEEVSEDVR